MNRIAYLGTWRGMGETPGYYFREISGSFSRQLVNVLTSLNDDYFRLLLGSMECIYFRYYTFMGYAIPRILEGEKPWGFSVIFVEFATTPTDIINALDAAPELKKRFIRRLPRPSDF